MRKKNVNVDWNTHPSPNFNWEQVQVELLMDIRGELQRLNELLHCSNFIGMPATLRAINRKLAKSRKAKS